MTENTIEEQHHWAVYAPNGDVLTTLAKAGDGSYWLYKHQLDGEVGPYPDRDRPMLQHKDTCPECEGRGHDNWSVHAMPIDDDGNPIISEHYKVDPTRDHDEPTTCGHCAGHGMVPKRGGSAYRTPAALKAGITKGTAKKCKGCNGRGLWMFVPIKRDCSTCGGFGKVLQWDPTRPVLPPNVSDCDSAPKSFMADYVNTVTITVTRTGRDMTWGEAHLGFIGFGSCVDYGRRWECGDDDELIFEVADSLVNGRHQFVKMINRGTRTFGPAIVIALTPQGYTTYVAEADLAPGIGALPPTYFPAVFNPLR